MSSLGPLAFPVGLRPAWLDACDLAPGPSKVQGKLAGWNFERKIMELLEANNCYNIYNLECYNVCCLVHEHI